MRVRPSIWLQIDAVRQRDVDICQLPIWLKPASMLRRQRIHECNCSVVVHR